MQTRLSKKKIADSNQLAHAIANLATSENEPEAHPLTPEQRSAIASALGKLGGRKGGLERAKRLSKKRRSEIAKKAARTRWSKIDND